MYHIRNFCANKVNHAIIWMGKILSGYIELKTAFSIIQI